MARTLHLTGPQEAALRSALEMYLEEQDPDDPDTDAEEILAELDGDDSPYVGGL